VVHKEKLRKAKPKYGLATPQPEEHDARSINVAIVSAMPVDDEPVVLVSDKPVEVKPLLDESKNIAACSIVCVDKGVQTDASCADRVSVQMLQRVEDCSFVRTPVRHFVGVAVRMRKGKDGHVDQLCGLGITRLLPGRAMQVHVQKRKVPIRVEKKKLEMPNDEGMTNGPSIFAYLVFGPEGTSVEGIVRPMKLAIWRSPGARLGMQCKI
jgi:hypothetical protein